MEALNCFLTSRGEGRSFKLVRLSIDWYRDGEPCLFLRTGLGRGKGGGGFGAGVERSDSEVEE